MSENIEWERFTKSEGRDLGIQVGNEIFWVSRSEMADVSPVFESILGGEFQESKDEIVKLPNKEPEDILEMLRCLFPTVGKGVKPIDDGNFDLLLQLANEYQINDLSDMCSWISDQKMKSQAKRVEDDEKLAKIIGSVVEKQQPETSPKRHAPRIMSTGLSRQFAGYSGPRKRLPIPEKSCNSSSFKRGRIEWEKFTKSEGRDLGLQVGDDIFWVSRRELADASPVFKSMLYGEFQESQKEIVELSDKEPEDILTMLRCLFPTIGKGTKQVDDGNFDLLAQLADEYQIKDLLDKCSAFLEKKLTEELSIWGTIELITKANQYHLKGAVRIGLRELSKFHPPELLKTPDFSDLPINMRLGVSFIGWIRESRPRGSHEYLGEDEYEEDEDEDEEDDWEDRHESAEKCKYCGYERCGMKYCNSHQMGDPPECDQTICRTCDKKCGSTDFVCECFDPIIEAELEKLGL